MSESKPEEKRPKPAGDDPGRPPAIPKPTREEINDLPLQAYPGRIVLVDSRGNLDSALKALQAEAILGFDTETRPTFRKGQINYPSLVQLATRSAVYLFRIRGLGRNRRLAALLADPTKLKVGVGLDHDIKALKEVFAFEPAGFLDLTSLARPLGIKAAGLRTLAAALLRFRISKGAKTSNWEKEELTLAQIRYAATDAWVSRELYLHLKELRRTSGSSD